MTVPSTTGARFPPLPEGARVGLLGGSFNPPHLGHLMLVDIAWGRLELDQLWVVPTFDHAFGKDLAPFEDRLEMCRLTFSPVGDRVHVLDVERHLPAPSYTVQTVRALLAQAPSAQPVWIVGSDILDELDRWREPDELQRLARLFVVPRPGYPHPERVDVDVTCPEVSSTAVRAACAAGRPPPRVLARAVERLITARGLYAPG